MASLKEEPLGRFDITYIIFIIFKHFDIRKNIGFEMCF